MGGHNAMKKRIRQGHTRWLNHCESGPDGRIERVYVTSIFVTAVRGERIVCRDWSGQKMILYPEHFEELHRTRRAAWSSAWDMVKKTDRLRGIEYAAAWSCA